MGIVAVFQLLVTNFIGFSFVQTFLVAWKENLQEHQ